MQNKGIVICVAVLLTLASIFYLSFSFATRYYDGDSVSVDSILPRYSNTVEIKGAVFRPGMYNLGDQINSVRTLVEHAEGQFICGFSMETENVIANSKDKLIHLLVR